MNLHLKNGLRVLTLFFIAALGVAGDLTVDPAGGDDNNAYPGPFQTIGKAISQAQAGDIILIQPGIYREYIDLENRSDLTLAAAMGPDTVFITGGIPSSSLQWEETAPGVWRTMLMDWSIREIPEFHDLHSGDEFPEFIVALDDHGQVVKRLPLARTPNWVDPFTTADENDDWHYHQDWYTADGGSMVVPKLPSDRFLNDGDPDNDNESIMDMSARSDWFLTDIDHHEFNSTDTIDLRTMPNLEGATVYITDTQSGHYLYRDYVVAHDRDNGRIQVKNGANQEPKHNIGVYSKYYLEGLFSFMDEADEWYLNRIPVQEDLPPGTEAAPKYELFLMSPVDPGQRNLEIARERILVRLDNTKNVTLKDLNVRLANHAALFMYNHGRNGEGTHHLNIENCSITYVSMGLYFKQDNASYKDPVVPVSDPDAMLKHVRIVDTEIGWVDYNPFKISQNWDGNSFANRPLQNPQGMEHILIENCEIHHSGHLGRSGGVSALNRVNSLIVRNSWFHHLAHNGLQVSYPCNAAERYDDIPLAPEEIAVGGLVFENNLFEYACLNQTDAGALKFWGHFPSDNAVFKDVLVAGNTFRYNRGWTYVNQQRGKYAELAYPDDGSAGYAADEKAFMGGTGLYLDLSSGFHVYGNRFYENGQANMRLGWSYRNGDLIIANNIFAEGTFGLNAATSPNQDGFPERRYPAFNVAIYNNIFFANEMTGVSIAAMDFKVTDALRLDHNLYMNNGWHLPEGELYRQGQFRLTWAGASGSGPVTAYNDIAELQSDTGSHGFVTWEGAGIFEDPSHLMFQNAASHDYRLDPNSAAIDRGKDPVEITALLNRLAVDYGLEVETPLPQAADGDGDGIAAFDMGAFEFTDPVCIRINQHPEDMTSCEGDPAFFTLDTSGGHPVTWQWYKDGVALEGATNAQLELPAVTPADQGFYSCTLTADCGTATTYAGELTVIAAGAQAPLWSAEAQNPQGRWQGAGIKDRTFRLLVKGESLPEGRNVRLVFRGRNDDLDYTLTQVSMAPRLGDTLDTDGGMVPVTFNGQDWASGVTVGANGATVISDPVPLLKAGTDYFVTFHVSGHSGIYLDWDGETTDDPINRSVWITAKDDDRSGVANWDSSGVTVETTQNFLYCLQEIQTDICLSSKPRSMFGANHYEGVLPFTVQFGQQASGMVTGFNWDFGDGSGSTDPNVVKTYMTAGRYPVSLTVSGSGDEDTYGQVVTVHPDPVWDAQVQNPEGRWGNSSRENRTFRHLVKGAAIQGDGAVLRLQLRGRSDSAGYRVSHVSIGERVPGTLAVAGPLVPVTFAGEDWSAGVYVAGNKSMANSDPISFPIQPDKDYFVTFFLAEGSPPYRDWDGVIKDDENRSCWYTHEGDDQSLTEDWSGVTISKTRNFLYAISGILVISK